MAPGQMFGWSNDDDDNETPTLTTKCLNNVLMGSRPWSKKTGIDARAKPKHNARPHFQWRVVVPVRLVGEIFHLRLPPRRADKTPLKIKAFVVFGFGPCVGRFPFFSTRDGPAKDGPDMNQMKERNHIAILGKSIVFFIFWLRRLPPQG